jgi:colanic acid/amylovoran biosynthesis glycosyltransferase
MRVLYITSSLPFGKGEAFVLPEMAELKALGHEVFLAPLWPRGKRMHHCAHVATEISGRTQFPSFAALTKALPGMRELVLRGKGRNKLKNLLAAFRATQLASIVKNFKIEHIHCHWAGCTASMGMVLSALTGIPWSLTAHRWDIAANNCLSVKARSASFVRFISENGLAMAKRLGIEGLSRAVVIHMGVSLAPERDLPRTETTEKHVILCPANLLPVKGHCDLITAMQMLRDAGCGCELHLAGDGPLRNQLETQAEQLGLRPVVKFLGALKHPEVLEYYRQGRAALVVLPSRDLGSGLHEGIPVSLIEAMAYRVPVISTQTGAIPELITSREGILVPQADPHALAEAIRTVLTCSGLSERFGRCGRERVEHDFSVKKTALKLAQMFQEHTAERALSTAGHQ